MKPEGVAIGEIPKKSKWTKEKGNKTCLINYHEKIGEYVYLIDNPYKSNLTNVWDLVMSSAFLSTWNVLIVDDYEMYVPYFYYYNIE